MEHGTLKKEVYETCEHGMCIEHSPEWNLIGDAYLVPNPQFVNKYKGILKQKIVNTEQIDTYSWEHCCNEEMSRYKMLRKKECKKCGRKTVTTVGEKIALCACCGRAKATSKNDPQYIDKGSGF